MQTVASTMIDFTTNILLPMFVPRLKDDDDKDSNSLDLIVSFEDEDGDEDEFSKE